MEDNKISSQPEVELEPDVIVPWPIVTAVLLFVAFAVLALALTGRGATLLDKAVDSPWSTQSTWQAADEIRSLVRREVLNDTVGMATLISISGVVLGLAFAGSRRSAMVQVLAGPIMGTEAKRKELLVQGEILAGLTLAIFAVGLLSAYAIRPGVFDQEIPNAYAVAAVAFWGSLARMAWQAKWYRFWQYVLTAIFIAMVPLVAYLLVSFHIYLTTIGVSFLLGAAMLCASDWCIHRYA